MANNKEALKALQQRLADRLKLAKEQPAVRNWLAVEAGAHGFLLPLAQAGEIFPMVPLQTVPHCQSWFLGIGNLRGQLHGVVSLAGFLGLSGQARPSALMFPESKSAGHLVAMGATAQVNTALLVDRLLGIRRPEELTPARDALGQAQPHFVAQAWTDASGRLWYELDLLALAADEVFLKVAA